MTPDDGSSQRINNEVDIAALSPQEAYQEFLQQRSSFEERISNYEQKDGNIIYDDKRVSWELKTGISVVLKTEDRRLEVSQGTYEIHLKYCDTDLDWQGRMRFMTIPGNSGLQFGLETTSGDKTLADGLEMSPVLAKKLCDGLKEAGEIIGKVTNGELSGDIFYTTALRRNAVHQEISQAIAYLRSNNHLPENELVRLLGENFPNINGNTLRALVYNRQYQVKWQGKASSSSEDANQEPTSQSAHAAAIFLSCFKYQFIQEGDMRYPITKRLLPGIITQDIISSAESLRAYFMEKRRHEPQVDIDERKYNLIENEKGRPARILYDQRQAAVIEVQKIIDSGNTDALFPLSQDASSELYTNRQSVINWLTQVDLKPVES